MHEERIRRLRDSGALNQRQADALLNSLQPLQTPQQRRRYTRLGWLLGFAAISLLWLLFASGGGEGEIQQVSATLNTSGSTGAMNKTVNGALALILLLFIPLLLWAWLYNSLVGKEERVFESWAQVEAGYQRRADLIPALIGAASRYLTHERDTLQDITEARSVTDDLVQAQRTAAERLRQQAGQPPEDEAALDALLRAQNALGLQLQRFIGVVEDYPQLRSADQFLQLQAQLEGTENRVNVARNRFNEAVRDYNRATRVLPTSLIAQLGDFHRKAYFKAEDEAAAMPGLGLQ